MVSRNDVSEPGDHPEGPAIGELGERAEKISSNDVSPNSISEISQHQEMSDRPYSQQEQHKSSPSPSGTVHDRNDPSSSEKQRQLSEKHNSEGASEALSTQYNLNDPSTRSSTQVIPQQPNQGQNQNQLGSGLDRAMSTPKPYSAFPQHTKWLIVAIGGAAGFFSPVSSNIFVPAIPTLAKDFNKSESEISLAITVYLIFQAITPSIFGSMSDSFGRRPIYIITLTVYMGANIGLALCPTSAYWLLLVLRMLQATGGSAVISIGAGSITDIAEPRERGKFYATFQLGALLGPAIGPLLGGILSGTLGWRSIFWFLAIADGVVLIPVIFLLPETLRSLVGDGSIRPPFINMSPPMMYRHKKMKRDLEKTGQEAEHVERPPKKKYQPLSAFMILFTPEIFLAFIFASMLYLEFYSILTFYSTALKQTYGLNDLKIGLAYLPNGVGTICASQINGRQLDWWYRKEEKRAGGDYGKKPDEFRIELTRLRCFIPFVCMFLCASTAQGWCLQANAPLAATLVVGFFVGLGTGTMSTVTLYGQDLLPGKGGAVSASFNLVRCLFGAVGTAVIQLLYNALGAGWSLVLLTGICIISIPIPVLIVKRARSWRIKRREKAERKAREKAERNGGSSEGVISSDGTRTLGLIERPIAR